MADSASNETPPRDPFAPAPQKASSTSPHTGAAVILVIICVFAVGFFYFLSFFDVRDNVQQGVQTIDIQYGVDVNKTADKMADCLKGLPRASQATFTLLFHFNPDRTIKTMDVSAEDQPRYARDSGFREVVDAVKNKMPTCTAFEDLPLDQYAHWQELPLSFNMSTPH